VRCAYAAVFPSGTAPTLWCFRRALRSRCGAFVVRCAYAAVFPSGAAPTLWCFRRALRSRCGAFVVRCAYAAVLPIVCDSWRHYGDAELPRSLFFI
jgi:hypothetical protein